jgi:hypothetical protein
MKDFLTLEDTARVLGISKEKCRAGIIQGALPFATYIKPDTPKGKYSFIIPAERLKKWLKGEFKG